MVRIALLTDHIPPENRGGAGIVVWRLAQGLRDAGHEVHVIATTALAPFEQMRDGIATYHVHVQYGPRWRAWWSLYHPWAVQAVRRLLKRIQPDVVNAHNIHEALSYGVLSAVRGLGLPVVFSSHDAMPYAYGKLMVSPASDPCQVSDAHLRLLPGANWRQARLRYNPFRNLVIRRALRQNTDVRTAVSHALARAHHANGLPAFRIVHNGVPPDALSTTPADVQRLAEQLGLAERDVILFAGRLTHEKGMTTLLDALDRLIAQRPRTTLLLLSAQELKRQFSPEQAHLLPYICAGGWLTGAALGAAFALARVVVVPSIYWDPFPTVNLEAMALGRPVVGTCLGGTPEAIADGETGFVINPFDAEALAGAIERLLNDETLAEEMGRAGKARVMAHFALAHQVDAMLAVYAEAQAMRASTARA